jgi:hypothetical protein
MATTYFGYCDPDTGAGTGTEKIYMNDEIYWATAGYACPGSGSQNVVSIGVELNESGGNFRVGVYSGTTLIVEANVEKSKVGGGWLEWTAAASELTWHVGTALTGGTTYKILVTTDTNSAFTGSTGRPANTLSYASGDYTAGMPDPSPAASTYTYEPNLRCGVEAAAGGGATYPARGIARGIGRGVGQGIGR